MNRFLLVLLSLSGLFCMAQENVTLSVNRTNKGYSYDTFTFPNDIMVFDLERNQHTLKPEGLTLVRVWTMRDKGHLEATIDRLAATYKEQGLTTLSVNFENGSSFNRQFNDLKAFFAQREVPENFYFDSMGFTVDLLNVRGFPIYYLVDKEGNVVFSTLGEDEHGVDLLEQEINKRLEGK